MKACTTLADKGGDPKGESGGSGSVPNCKDPKGGQDPTGPPLNHGKPADKSISKFCKRGPKTFHSNSVTHRIAYTKGSSIS